MRNWQRKTATFLCAALMLGAAPGGFAAAADTAPSQSAAASSGNGIRVIIGKPQDGTGTFSIGASGIPDGAQKVQMIVMPEGHSNRKAVYDAQRTGSVYQTDVDVARHGSLAGMYSTYVLVTDAEGKRIYSASAHVDVAPVPGILLAYPINDAQDGFRFLLMDAAVQDDADVTVHIEREGDDEFKLDKEMSVSGSAYAVSTPAAELEEAGSYTATAFCTSPGGEAVELGQTEFTVSGVTSSGAYIEPVMNNGTFLVRAFAASPSGVNAMQAEVWCAADKDDVHVYTMRKVGNEWAVSAKTSDFARSTGMYFAKTYATLGNGVQAEASECRFNIG